MDQNSGYESSILSTGQQKEALEIATNINLREWNPKKDLPDHAYTILIYAQRGAGKSHLVKYFLHEQKKMFDEIYLMSGTADLGQDAYSFIPRENRISKLDPAYIEELVEKQKELIIREKKGENVKVKRICLYLDDCISEKSFVNSTAVKNLFILGRHCRIHVIVNAQSIGGKDSIPLVMRDNADIVIVFKLYNQYVRDLVSEQFLSLYNKKIGDALFKVTTEPQYQAIVICRYINDAKKYEDYVYKIKAPERLKEYVIGNTKKKEIVVQAYTKDKLGGFEIPKLFIPIEDQSGEKNITTEIVY